MIEESLNGEKMKKIIMTYAKLMICMLTLSCANAFDQNQEGLLAEHNRQRTQRGLKSLELDSKLCEYAQKHAEKMAERGFLAHSSMARLAEVAGSHSVAENIAWGQETEKEACDSWMNSSGHRSNILNKSHKRVGFGVQEDSRGRKYWCAVFSN